MTIRVSSVLLALAMVVTLCCCKTTDQNLANDRPNLLFFHSAT